MLKVHAVHQWQKGITDISIICQLHPFVMNKQNALNKFVLQALNMDLSLLENLRQYYDAAWLWLKCLVHKLKMWNVVMNDALHK